MCSREQDFNSMLFSLCFFHACVSERRKFGPQGWNCNYPFSAGDLTISANILCNYLDANTKVPSLFFKYIKTFPLLFVINNNSFDINKW